MPPVELPVTRIEQRPGLCGAASAQMILHSKGMIGSTLVDQDVLWGEIQANTGAVRPSGSIKPHDCPAWPAQACDKCAGESQYTCWCSYPPALTTTMVNRGLAMVQSVHGNDHDATLAAINSVDFNLPAAALVKGGTHWIVVAGYNPEASADSEVIGGRAIRDILVRNPTVGAANQSIAIKTWMFDELLPNTLCGPFLNKLVMIGAVALFAPPGPSAPSAPAGVRIKRRPVPKRLPKPKRPGRPPKPPKGPKKKKRGKRRG